MNAEGLSLRGGRRPTRQSRSTRPNRGEAIGEIVTACMRLPRRFAPRNDKPDRLVPRANAQTGRPGRENFEICHKFFIFSS